MTLEYLKQHFAFRRARAKSFIDDPARFKICDQCWSVSVARANLCPVCGCYRWDDSAKRVIRIAKRIAKNPFPLTAAVVPRLANSGCTNTTIRGGLSGGGGPRLPSLD